MNETLRMARYLWAGICISLAFFFSQSWKMAGGSQGTWVSYWVADSLFFIISLLTLVYGLIFFRNYAKYRVKDIVDGDTKERKNTLLLAYVVQFLLLETVGIYGLVLAVFTQCGLKSIPFVLMAYGGLTKCFPKAEQLTLFFPNQENSDET